jgi:hypothetical protein
VLAVICDPAFDIILYGIGLNGVENLFVFGILSSTQSPSLNPEYLALFLLSEYSSASTGDHTITRNSSHFKKIKKELMEDTFNKDNDLDEEQLELDNEEFQNNTSDNKGLFCPFHIFTQFPTNYLHT